VCECMGGGGRGCGWPQLAAHAALEGAERARTLPQTLRRHASGATGPIVAPATARRAHLAATHPVVGTEPSPGGTMCVRRPLTPIEADCGEDGVDRQGLETRHVGKRHAGDPGQRSAESKRWRVSWRWSLGGGRWREGVGITSNQGRQGAEDPCAVLIAGRHGLLGHLREGQGWGERAARLRAILPLAGLDQEVRTGGAARVAILGSGPRVALSRNDRAEPAQACHACPSTHHLGQGQSLEGGRVLLAFFRHTCLQAGGEREE
jgi:hypothetical protein